MNVRIAHYMNVKIESSWKKALAGEFEKDYFKTLTGFVKKQYKKRTVFPSPKFIFRAFDLTPFNKTKVVILGQDPYHGNGQANGLCFAVGDGVPLPPSLQNIYKEIEKDIGAKPKWSGDLERWARQGVLLLNATLTVQARSPGSHQDKGWEQFTDEVINVLSQKRKNLVFLLWGAYAQRKGQVIARDRGHLILKSAHPSPFSAHSGFFGSGHFSQTNIFLTMSGQEEIEW